MKLDNAVPFGRPQSGTVIIPLMTELDFSYKINIRTAIPKPPRKQNNALICNTLYALCIETKRNFVNQNKGKITLIIFPRGKVSLAMS